MALLLTRCRDWGCAALRRLTDALSDPARRHYAVLGVVLAYAALWALYAVIAKSSQGINADMAEMIVWTREPALGYPKHPPFLAWVLTAWFSVFPLADWAYYLLAALNLAAGLYAAWLLAGEWLDGPKRAAVPFVLALIPFYNFLGLKFDQNSALIPLWGFTAWAFLRSLDTRRWSAFLLLALVLVALLDRRRAAYFRSAAPWVTALVGAAAVAPHAYWLVREHFPPLTWVATRRASASLADALRSLTEYSAGTLGYAAVAIAVVLLIVRPSRKGLRDGLLPRDPDRRRAALLFWAPLLIPIPVAFASGTNLLSLWNTPALNLLPVLLLGSPLVTVTGAQVARIAAVAVTVTLVALLASPVIAFAILRGGVENNAAYVHPVAAVLEREWKRTTDRPLALIAGPFTLVSSVAMYIRDRPSTWADFSPYLSPWVDDSRIARDGVAIVCPADEGWCVDAITRLARQRPEARRAEIELTPRWLGLPGTPQRFVIVTMPPRP
jgi:hypothetical protein